MSHLRHSTVAPLWRRIAGLLCLLVVAANAIEIHELNHQHRDFALARVLEQAASHPRIPHHFDRSELRREAPCATCVRQAQNHGVQSSAAGRPERVPAAACEPSRLAAIHFSALPSSTSPRGPPAA